MASYFIEGPIYDNSSVMLCAFYGITPYYICRSEDAYVALEYSSTMPIATFKIKVDTSTTFKLIDQLYSKNALVDPTTNILNLTTGNPIITAYNIKYQPWNDVPFLAGETYQMRSNDNFIIVDNVPFSIVYVIPTSWFQRGACQQSQDYLSALLFNQSSLTGSNSTIMGWTTVNECNENIVYTYCNKGYNCSSQCKASCPHPNDNCFWSVNAQSFECGRGPGGIFNGNWWSSIWFLTLISILLLIFILAYPINLLLKDKSQDNTSKMNNSIY